jgi:maleate isomerase
MSGPIPHRIGLIVPSTNTTMETELPEMFARRAGMTGEHYTFHSSRAVLRSVDQESLDRMVGELDRCVHELVDARVDAILYACLVAVMAQGPGAHLDAERQIGEIVAGRGSDALVSSSAGALVRALHALQLERVAIMTPYVESLTNAVATYLESTGVRVVKAVSLAVDDNVEVGRLDQGDLLNRALKLDLGGAQGLVISACVQMPSLRVVSKAEQELGIPVISAATAGVFELLAGRGVTPQVPDAGSLLGGGVSRVEAA